MLVSNETFEWNKRNFKNQDINYKPILNRRKNNRINIQVVRRNGNV